MTQIITAESIQTAPIEAERAGLIQQAKAIEVYDRDSVAQADRLLIALTTGIANIKEGLKPMRESTTAAWKAGTALEARLVGPLEEAKKDLASRRGQVVKALEKAAQEAAEAASRALDSGDLDAADTLQQAAQDVVPKGAVSSREIWKAEVTDMDALILAAARDKSLRSLLMVNESALNKLASIQQERMEIPGVRVFSEFTSSARTKPARWRMLEP